MMTTAMQRLLMIIASLAEAQDVLNRTDCINNSHIIGRWEEKNITRKNYHCCGYDKLDHRHNIDICGGINLAGLDENIGSNENMAQTGGHACWCDRDQGRYSVNRRERYQWVPKYCTLQMWNASYFCELLGDRKILFVGDSTMQQTAHAAMGMILGYNGGCNDHLTFSKRVKNYLFSDIAQLLIRHDPDIAVINHGAHAMDDGDILTIFHNIRTELTSPAYLAARKNISFVWRTNNPGHINCSFFLEPNSEFKMYNQSIDWYRWSLFPHWDSMSYEFAAEMGWRVLDMSPLYTRHDSHPGFADCLHYCLPGPVDIAAVILLQMLHNKEI